MHSPWRISHNLVTILSNRFETDFELDIVMRMEVGGKSVLNVFINV